MRPILNREIHIHRDDWADYALLDSGHRRKLERFGEITLIRAEPKAWWRPELSENAWRKADGECDDEGRWEFRRPINREWPMRLGNLTLAARCTDMSKHVGVFPEQSTQWRWLQNRRPGEGKSVLNLFGYTGVATLAAAAAGDSVTHVDASKPALAWARENQAFSGLQNAPIRWILDDAQKFVRREISRGRRYDGILLDPPSFGRGPKQEVWKVETSLPGLLDDCRKLLSDEPEFVVMTLYSLSASSLIIGNLLSDMLTGLGGDINLGELTLQPKASEKAVPLALFGRWTAQDR